MNCDHLREKARLEAKDFLENEGEYRLGDIQSELPHPLTKNLSQTFAKSVENGVRLILSVDREMSLRAKACFATEEYALFADTVRGTLKNGGRVIFSGCGSSGRLAMRLEQSWRNAIATLSDAYPAAKERLASKLDAVGNIMTGGDYAVIRAVESFEDSTLLGKAQAKEWNLTNKDLLVGVTATGETTSILGSAMQALEDGGRVYMLICSDPSGIIDRLARAKAVYLHENASHLVLPCGSMALTGSTRMQSSTFEQLACAIALEGALCDLLQEVGIHLPLPTYAEFGTYFKETVDKLLSEPCVQALSTCVLREQEVYENGGLVTLFADEYLLDVLTDTTERAPTFMTPPFRSADMKDAPQSWAFVKNPNASTDKAWRDCFLREPRCIEWEKSTYEALGLSAKQIEKIPDIGLSALKRFLIGNEPDPARENAPDSHALWVDGKSAPESFSEHAARYRSAGQLTLEGAGIALPPTAMDLYEHLAVKIMLNTLSTGVMARMGKILGNWMICLAMSNKKLVDRSARIVADLCQVPYERALEEVFYAKAASESEETLKSPAESAIQRLGIK